ncbi:MAG: putative transcriptional regulator, partial [Bryobacterales bacterium]|nr:putative transcriptional regulator [Bryobacterales bacterium]
MLPNVAQGGRGVGGRPAAFDRDIDKKPQVPAKCAWPCATTSCCHSATTVHQGRFTCANIGCILQVMMIIVSGVPGKPKKRRSGCPVSVSLEMFGDRWSLLIVRDLMVRGFRSFKEFQESGEGIATNILADRLR